MDKERLENLQDEMKNNALPETDVSRHNGSQNKQTGFTGIFSRIGFRGIKLIAAVLLGVVKSIRFIGSELVSLFRSLMSGVEWCLKAVLRPIKKRLRLTAAMQKSLRRAKKSGKKAYAKELIKSIGIYLFGEEGIFYSSFNYVLPIISATFFIGVVTYGSGLEYGIAVEYNGTEIGIIASESDFDNAAREVQQRISYSEDDDIIDIAPKFSLRIISDDEHFVSAAALADEMLAVSDQELSEAFGIYIDGSFIGAVKDKTPIENVLNDLLVNYKTEGTVKDISFKNKIEFTEGVYLADSVMTETEAVSTLTAKKETTSTYVIQSGDTPQVICKKHNMELSELRRLNPGIDDSCEEGKVITVTEVESFLPIQYVREMETISILGYETQEVETSALNVGTTSILVKGETGERRSTVEVTYIDGIERARKVVSSKITKAPVNEQIGIGTYVARPASIDTLLHGNGKFGWPVDGGYVSDPFLSNRNHKGMDIAAPAGSDIYAAADGVVVSSGWNPGGYGYFVMIDHQDGYQTVYAHCSALFATEGQYVTRGQLIAAVGNTGDSYGNHCHFEVRCLGVCYDPASFINTISVTE